MIIVLDYMVWYVRLINKKTVLFLTCFYSICETRDMIINTQKCAYHDNPNVDQHQQNDKYI